MNSHDAIIAAVGILSLSSLSVCLGGHAQPSAPVIPNTFAQNQHQSGQPNSNTSHPNQPNSGQPQNVTNTPQNSGTPQYNPKNNPSQNLNQNQNSYGYYNPYGYGQPTYGVYYPNGSPSGTSGNPNSVSQSSTNNNNNNAPAPGVFVPPPVADSNASSAPAAATPPAPPDPEVIQATADLNAAMDHLRQTLLNTDPEYRTAVADKRTAQAETAALHASDQPVAPETIVASASRGLLAATKVTQIEREAAAKDQTVQDAQSKLNTAMAAHAGVK